MQETSPAPDYLPLPLPNTSPASQRYSSGATAQIYVGSFRQNLGTAVFFAVVAEHHLPRLQG